MGMRQNAGRIAFTICLTLGWAAATRAGDIEIDWTDLAGASALAADAQREVTDALQPLRLSIDWRTVPCDEPVGPQALHVILLPEAPPGQREHRVLGSSAPSEHTSWIYLDGVVHMLDAPWEPLSSPAIRRHLIARALGRVIAHELLHLIAPEFGHDESGLLHHSLSQQHLLADHLRPSAAFVSWFESRAAVTRTTDLDPGAAPRHPSARGSRVARTARP